MEKIKNILFELEKYFIELEDRGLKGRQVKIKREIKQLFLKQNIVSIDETDEFE